MELAVKRVRSNAALPKYGSAGAAGLDLAACLEAPRTLAPGEQLLIPTGIAVALPPGTVGLLYVRSSLGARWGVTLPNGVGVIDEDYRGEIQVALVNLSAQPYTVEPGDRIAQLIVTPYLRAEVEETDCLPQTQRGMDGFGSTGR